MGENGGEKWSRIFFQIPPCASHFLFNELKIVALIQFYLLSNFCCQKLNLHNIGKPSNDSLMNDRNL